MTDRDLENILTSNTNHCSTQALNEKSEECELDTLWSNSKSGQRENSEAQHYNNVNFEVKLYPKKVYNKSINYFEEVGADDQKDNEISIAIQEEPIANRSHSDNIQKKIEELINDIEIKKSHDFKNIKSNMTELPN